jgi:hypothetical protein
MSDLSPFCAAKRHSLFEQGRGALIPMRINGGTIGARSLCSKKSADRRGECETSGTSRN